jgi:hypothetical protein
MDMKCNHKKIIAQHKNVAHMANNGGKGKERDNKKTHTQSIAVLTSQSLTDSQVSACVPMS